MISVGADYGFSPRKAGVNHLPIEMIDQVQTNLKEFSPSFESLSIKARDVEKAMGRYNKGTPTLLPI